MSTVAKSTFVQTGVKRSFIYQKLSIIEWSSPSKVVSRARPFSRHAWQHRVTTPKSCRSDVNVSSLRYTASWCLTAGASFAAGDPVLYNRKADRQNCTFASHPPQEDQHDSCGFSC